MIQKKYQEKEMIIQEIKKIYIYIFLEKDHMLLNSHCSEEIS